MVYYILNMNSIFFIVNNLKKVKTKPSKNRLPVRPGIVFTTFQIFLRIKTCD